MTWVQNGNHLHSFLGYKIWMRIAGDIEGLSGMKRTWSRDVLLHGRMFALRVMHYLLETTKELNKRSHVIMVTTIGGKKICNCTILSKPTKMYWFLPWHYAPPLHKIILVPFIIIIMVCQGEMCTLCCTRKNPNPQTQACKASRSPVTVIRTQALWK